MYSIHLYVLVVRLLVESPTPFISSPSSHQFSTFLTKSIAEPMCSSRGAINLGNEHLLHRGVIHSSFSAVPKVISISLCVLLPPWPPTLSLLFSSTSKPDHSVPHHDLALSVFSRHPFFFFFPASASLRL